MGKLTDRQVKSLGPGTWGDGAGLYLEVAVSGSRGWLYRFRVGKKTTWMGLGGYPVVGLADARDAALAARRVVRAGGNPMEEKRAAKAAARAERAIKSFAAVADEYILSHKAGWKNAKHGGQWKATLAAYAFPIFGDRPVNSITIDDVLGALTPIWQEKPETATRLRGRIEAVLDYAKTRGWRVGENPARWKGHLDHILPARTKVARVVHHAALPWADLPAVMAKLAPSEATSALCLRFTILTAARSGEGRGARWEEIDLAGKVWTIPAERMKAASAHRVPLSDAALAVLTTMLPPHGDATGLVFPGGKPGAPLTDVAVSKALAGVADGVTVHGMRSTFRDWAAERTNYPREVAEAALAHANGDKVEAAYRRSDLFEQRARLMRQWGEFCTRPPAATSVTPIQATA